LSRVGAKTTRRDLRVVERRRVELQLVEDAAHYREVIERGILTATTSIWIATANVKDAHIEAPLGTRARARGRYTSLFEWLWERAEAGLEVRILHGATPSRALQRHVRWKDAQGLYRCCPRVHLKMVAVDGRFLYLGSANLTGAGLGAKSDRKRNFEAGIVTDDPVLLDQLQSNFDRIWNGKLCGNCAMRAHCPGPLDNLSGKAQVTRAQHEEGTRSARRKR
jgi:phosphatidylserine/phosphatidylglycerophosphate/cardiolipin synthase-like enzyme